MKDSPYIRIKDLDLPDMEDGEQISMNHERCPAGTDTKGRLFVKRDGDTTLAYCHNCQLQGVMSTQVSHIRRSGGENLLLEASTLELPSDMNYDLRTQPVEHVVWLKKYGIPLSVQTQYGIGWSNRWGRTILPVYDEEKLVAFQRRNVLAHDTGPKYLTTRLRHVKNPVFRNVNRGGQTLVLTEDILSAIKVGMAGFPAWALLGTWLTRSALDDIAAAGVQRVVIWLDDDNRSVRKAQKGMRKRIQQVADTTVVRHRHLGLAKHKTADPKALLVDDIANVIEELTDE